RVGGLSVPLQGSLHGQQPAFPRTGGAHQPEYPGPDSRAGGDRRQGGEDRRAPAQPGLRRAGHPGLAYRTGFVPAGAAALCRAAGLARGAGRPVRRLANHAGRLSPGVAVTLPRGSTMKLSLGPVLFYWDRQQTLDFYADMASLPLDVIYLGETVCSKRRAMCLDDWIGLGRDLAQESSAQIVLSGLTLVEAASELSGLRRLCDNGELLVEANDMGAVQYLSEKGLPFVGGPALNLYNGYALAELVGSGMCRWVPPVEISGAMVRDARAQLATLDVAMPELEIFAYGHLPLAYSARCFTARAENRPKDDCQFCCQNYPEGIPLLSQEGEALFTINGIQTMSASVSNLLADYPALEASGADLLRLSPRAAGMPEVVAAFDAVRQGGLPPLAVEGCNGYWHGQPGMLRAEEVGLC